MSSDLISAAASYREALAGLDFALLSASDCALLEEQLAATQKALHAALLLAAAHAIACGAHLDLGFSDGAAWLAHLIGGTVGQARQALEAAAALNARPDIRSALLSGGASPAQGSVRKGP
jgi:hypothetical protein